MQATILYGYPGIIHGVAGTAARQGIREVCGYRRSLRSATGAVARHSDETHCARGPLGRPPLRPRRPSGNHFVAAELCGRANRSQCRHGLSRRPRSWNGRLSRVRRRRRAAAVVSQSQGVPSLTPRGLRLAADELSTPACSALGTAAKPPRTDTGPAANAERRDGRTGAPLPRRGRRP